MGQYHEIYNLDMKEKLYPHALGSGMKAGEQVGWDKSPSTALFMLLMNSNGRGGGDFPEHPMIGRWAGCRVVVQGDDAESDAPSFIPEAELDGYRDISGYAKKMMDSVSWLNGGSDDGYLARVSDEAVRATGWFRTPEEYEASREGGGQG
jgi:hypothetical protein